LKSATSIGKENEIKRGFGNQSIILWKKNLVFSGGGKGRRLDCWGSGLAHHHWKGRGEVALFGRKSSDTSKEHSSEKEGRKEG